MRRASRWPFVIAVGGSLAAVAFFPSAVQAQYLDPGAGSVIVQVVIALVIGLSAALKLYWRKISEFLARRSKTDAQR